MAYKLPPLRFGYDALEPSVDAETMELHHDKHHQAYVDHLNAALAPYPELPDLTIEDRLRRLDQRDFAPSSAFSRCSPTPRPSTT